VEAVFSDDRAGRGGIALPRIAGPIPALCCGDLLNEAAARGRIGGRKCSGLFTTRNTVAGLRPRYEPNSNVN